MTQPTIDTPEASLWAEDYIQTQSDPGEPAAKPSRAQFEQAYRDAVDKLIAPMLAEVQPLVNAVCEKYGVEFTAGNGDWDFYVPNYATWAVEQTAIIEALEPELSGLLWTLLGNLSLGALLDDYQPTSAYPRVKMGIVGADLTLTSLSGPIPKPLADGFCDLETSERTELFENLPPAGAYIPEE